MMKKKRVIVTDDEALARTALRLSLEEIDEIEIVAECADGYEALKAVQKLNPDLLFLDIQMPGLNGFDVMELLGKNAPPVIFVTAYDEYAVKAFEAHALDYLLKPVRVERLRQAIERVRELPEKETADILDSYRKTQPPLNRILIRSGNSVKIIPVEKIMYFEAQDDFVEVHTEQGSHLKYERLGRLEQLLDSRTFIRVHRSFILNILFLNKVEPYSKDSRLAYLKNGDVVQVSKNGYKKLRALL